MPKYQPPETFDFSKPALWPEWKARFMRYFTLEKLKDEKGEIQVSALVYTMGRQAEHIYKSFKFDPPPAPTEAVPEPPDPKDDFKAVLQKFDDYFVPRRNTIHERTKFYLRTQQQGESIEGFVRSLHELAEHCNFGDKEEEYIRDRLITGMSDKDLSRDLQMEQETLTLSAAVDRARHKELVQATLTEGTVSAVRNKNPNHSHGKSSKQSKSPRQQQNPPSQSQPNHSQKKCPNCGYVHRSKRPDACPARGKECNFCHSIGHFASACRKKKVQQVQEGNDSPPSEQSCSTVSVEYFVGGVQCNNDTLAWKIFLNFGKSSVAFKIDSGADVTVMSYANYLKITP